MLYPLDLIDPFDFHNRLNHPIKMIEVLNVDFKNIEPLTVGGRLNIGAGDIGLAVGYGPGNTGEHALLVGAMHPDSVV